MSQSYQMPIADTERIDVSRPKINGAFDALRTCFSGSNAPPSPVRGQLWLDTDTDALAIYDGSEWRTLAPDAGSPGCGLLARDGSQSLSGNLPAGGHRITGLGRADAATDAPTRGQVDDRRMVVAVSLGDVSVGLSTYVLTHPDAVTISDVALVTRATVASTSSARWTFQVRDAFAGTNLRASAYDSNTDGDLTAHRRSPLGLDQNLALPAGNGMELVVTKIGTPGALLGLTAVVEYTVATPD